MRTWFEAPKIRNKNPPRLFPNAFACFWYLGSHGRLWFATPTANVQQNYLNDPASGPLSRLKAEDRASISAPFSSSTW